MKELCTNSTYERHIILALCSKSKVSHKSKQQEVESKGNHEDTKRISEPFHDHSNRPKRFGKLEHAEEFDVEQKTQDADHSLKGRISGR